MRNVKGFTLLELCIAVALVSILAAIAIPNYIGWLPKRHLRSSAIDVQAAVNLAKITAIRENTNVVLTFNPANDDYLAFIDYGDGAGGLPNGSQDAGEPTIRNKEMSPGIDMTGTGFGSDTITFSSRGLANAAGNITLSNRLGQNLTVSVTLTGVSRIL